MTLDVVGPWIADGFIVLGVVVMTIGVVGIVRMPDVHNKLHAASKAVFLGVCSFLVAMVEIGDPAFVARAVLIGLLLIVTTPVAAYEIARAAVEEEKAHAANRGESLKSIADRVKGYRPVEDV